MRTRPAILPITLMSLLLALPVLPGCLWLPDWPFADKVDPDPPTDTLPFAYCSPKPNRWEPVLVGAITGPRSVQCRIRGAESILWTLDTEVDESDPLLGLDVGLLEDAAPVLSGPLILGRNVEGVTIDRDSLPWSPRPYGAILRASVQLPNEVTTKRWPILVVPAADELEGTFSANPGEPTGGDAP